MAPDGHHVNILNLGGGIQPQQEKGVGRQPQDLSDRGDTSDEDDNNQNNQ